MKLVFAAVVAVGLSGCSTTITLPAYQVSGSTTLAGEIARVDSTYTPQGKVTQTQIRETALGMILLTEPVPNYVANALRLELRAAGVKLDQGACVLKLKVNDYAIDDLGFNATYISDIDYELSASQPIYRRNVHTAFTTDKFVVPEILLANLRGALARNFDEVMRDAKFRQAMATGCNGPAAAPTAKVAPKSQ